MLLFGHIGLTIGIAKLCQDLIIPRRIEIDNSSPGGHISVKEKSKISFLDNIQGKKKFFDYRFILLGSLLPDIIDKPLWLFTNTPLKWDGRGYSHTFIFSFVLLVIGLILAVRWKKFQLLAISAASFFHLIFDQMWLNPTALWWPILGSIPREQIEEYLLFLWKVLIVDPYTFVTECLGLAIIILIVLRAIRRKQIVNFLKTGDIDPGFR